MLSLEAYLNDPCGTLSIPYWKNKGIILPPDMRIVHENSFDGAMLEDFTDTPYFRLLHTLEDIDTAIPAHILVKTATEADIPVIVDVINGSYEDLSVSLEQVRSFRSHPTYDSDLWILAVDRAGGAVAGCGIGEFDEEAGEGVLEWIQVLPAYRGRGIGRLIVNQLLSRMRFRAKFATVSGQIRNRTKPERLYRKCGFSGEDVWHILRRR